MKRLLMSGSAIAVLIVGTANVAHAQVSVTLPSTSQTTTLTATVAEQAQVTVPGTVSFSVGDVATATASGNVSVSASNIVLATATKQFKVSLQANAATFTPPSGAVTWNATDVSWNAPTWTNATGSAGTLSSAAYNAVATCTAGVATCSTTGLVFTLGPNSNIVRSGNYTLVVTWKFESIGA